MEYIVETPRLLRQAKCAYHMVNRAMGILGPDTDLFISALDSMDDYLTVEVGIHCRQYPLLIEALLAAMEEFLCPADRERMEDSFIEVLTCACDILVAIHKTKSVQQQ